MDVSEGSENNHYSLIEKNQFKITTPSFFEIKGKANFEKNAMDQFAGDVRKKVMELLRQSCKISDSEALIRKSGVIRQDSYISSFKKGIEDMHNSVSRVEKSKFRK